MKRQRPAPLEPALARAIEWRGKWNRALLRRYSGKWVAIRGERVVVSARTCDALMNALDRLGRPPVLIARIEAPGLVAY